MASCREPFTGHNKDLSFNACKFGRKHDVVTATIKSAALFLLVLPWVIPEDDKITQSMVASFDGCWGGAKVDKWTFSTNGVSIMGREGIPCIGLGPGKEEEAHAPNEKTWKADLVQCAAVYAGLPSIYVSK